MHAYLLVGNDPSEIEHEVFRLSKKLKAKVLPFRLQKIEDVRNLSSFTKLSISEPTAIFVNNIESASAPTLNAFLKNLEEPQVNLYYVLTTSNIHILPQTILSRCQVLTTKQGPKSASDAIFTKKFLEGSKSNKLLAVSAFRKREEALGFIERIIYGGQALLIQDSQNDTISICLKSALSTRVALLANGNVGLQLTNFVVNLV